MPLSDDLLNPVPGANPSGSNLRYAPILDKIKEARREEELVPQGEWVRERKKADYKLSLSLCSDALAKSKDLQVAAWAVEALIKLEGLAGLRQGIEFLRRLLENFWASLYPELEEGDTEMRAAPLEWVGTKLAGQLMSVSLTRSRLDWLKYKESRAVGYEQAVAGNEVKQQARERDISEGKITAEEFDEAVADTPRAFYEALFAETEACAASLEALNHTCETSFGDFRPSFAPLREGLEEIQLTIKSLLQEKRKQEPEQATNGTEVTQQDVGSGAEGDTTEPAEQSVPAAIAESKREGLTLAREPVDENDAINRVMVAASYLLREKPYSPVSYLLLRALRWGELRATGAELDASQLEAPARETRKLLRGHLQNGEWQQLLEASEAAMATTCGRGWLDLQRYAVKAAQELGDSYAAVWVAIISQLKALIGDYPQLAHSVLNDETPTANPETQAWLADLSKASAQQAEPEAWTEPQAAADVSESGEIDVYERAKQAADAGRAQEAIALLEREISQERSGRGRFKRKLQLAQICITAGHMGVALPMLEALTSEIDRRNLEEWEGSETVLHALRLYYVCLEKLKRNPEERERIYARICRLGPVEALELVR